jgi:non-ribosomal peptide synthetase component F
MNCMTMARVGSREAALPEHSAETEPRGVEARSLTLADLVEAAAEAAGSRTAIVLDDRSLSYGELWAGGERRARQMVALGLRHGDRVGVLLPNSLEYLEIVLGAAIIGAITVPMNIRYKARELAHLISDSGMVALFSRSSAPGGADLTRPTIRPPWRLPPLRPCGRSSRWAKRTHASCRKIRLPLRAPRCRIGPGPRMPCC